MRNMCLVRIIKHLSRKVGPVEPSSLSRQPPNCFLVYDFEGESTIKQVGWEVWGFFLSVPRKHMPKIKRMGGKMTVSDGSSRIWKHRQSWDQVQAGARSGQALFLI